ncbi:uncharacterized protein FFFS_16058 [Fusarium fujikuroi]|nr:uncharacterized protein FFFS_16058 [Fusarium fujikuroi]
MVVVPSSCEIRGGHHSSIYAYPAPLQNPGPDPFPGQIRPSLPGYPAPPDNSLPQIQARRHRAS